MQTIEQLTSLKQNFMSWLSRLQKIELIADDESNHVPISPQIKDNLLQDLIHFEKDFLTLCAQINDAYPSSNFSNLSERIIERLKRHLAFQNGGWASDSIDAAKAFVTVVEAEIESLQHFKLNLKSPKYKLNAITRNISLFAEPNLQFRVESEGSIIASLNSGVRSNIPLSIEDITSDQSMFTILKRWIGTTQSTLSLSKSALVNRELITSDGLSHDANVHYPAISLLIFKDILENGSTKRIYYKDSNMQDRIIINSIYQSFCGFADIGALNRIDAKNYFFEVTGVHISEESAFQTEKCIFAGAMDIGKLKQYKLDIKKLKKLSFLLPYLDQACIFMNKLLVKEKLTIFGAMSLVLHAPPNNVLKTFHADYPDQATIVGMRLQPKYIRGILVNSNWIRNNNHAVTVKSAEELLEIAITTDIFWDFIISLKTAGCPSCVLKKLNIMKQLKGEFIRRDFKEFYNAQIYSELLTFVELYFQKYLPVFNSGENKIASLLSYCSKRGYPVWDNDGNLLNKEILSN